VSLEPKTKGRETRKRKIDRNNIDRKKGSIGRMLGRRRRESGNEKKERKP
jgi:hypothetical protein